MKKLFGRDKPRMQRVQNVPNISPQIDSDPHPIYTTQTQPAKQYPDRSASLGRPSLDDATTVQDWDIVSDHHRPPPLATAASRSSSLNTPPLPTPQYATYSPASPGLPPPRSPSPSVFSSGSTLSKAERKEERRIAREEMARKNEDEVLRKTPIPGAGRRAVGLLAALEPNTPPQGAARGISAPGTVNGHGSEYGTGSQYAHGYESSQQHEHHASQTESFGSYASTPREKEKKSFWGRPGKEAKEEKARAKEAEKEREREKALQKERERLLLREREKEKEREKERVREREERERRKEMERERHLEEMPADLTRMIGWLTATASEDWSLVLEVCERASANPENAREAIRALRKEFKYAEPPAQLSAARLLAIMLRNSSPIFLAQCSSRKFLDALEDVLTSPRTNPVVRERLMDVLAGAAWICSQEISERAKGAQAVPFLSVQGSYGVKHESTDHSNGFWSEKDDFRSLWRRVRPADKPEQGIPFDTEDAMFNPPTTRRPSSFIAPAHGPMHAEPLLEPARPKPERRDTPPKPHKHRARNRVIPPDEDIRRLFEECKVGRGNATLFNEALAFAKPEELAKEVIQEFHQKCRASHEFIFAQIPWATATAERSRGTPPTEANRQLDGDERDSGMTKEEELLAELLSVNEELQSVLRQYDDLVRLGAERDAEERSRTDYRMDRTQLYADQNGVGAGLAPPASTAGASSSRSSSRSPSPGSSPSNSAVFPPPVIPSQAHPLPPIPGAGKRSLAPPTHALHGPRSPAQRRSPSPESMHSRTTSSTGLGRLDTEARERRWSGEEDGADTPVKPSAKALGKRRVVVEEPASPARDPDDVFGGYG